MAEPLIGTATQTPEGYSTNVVAPVSSSSIQNTNPVVVPQTPVISPLLASQGIADANKLVVDTTTGVTGQEEKTKGLESSYLSLSDMLAGKTAEQTQLQANAGLIDKNTELANLNKLQREQQAQYIAGLKNIEAGNIRSLSTNQQVALNRQKAIDSLLTSSLISAKENDIATTNARIKQALDLKYEPIEARQKSIETVLGFAYKDLTRADQKLADAKLAQGKLIEEKKKKDEETLKMISDASQVAPTSLVQEAFKMFNEGKSATEIAMKLGQYVGNYLANEKLKAELIKIRKETEKISIGISEESKPIVDSWVKRINEGKAKISDVPSNLKNAVTVGLASTPIGGVDTSLVQGLRETSNNIQSLIDTNGLSLAVGTAPLGRQDVLQGFRSDRQDFVAGIEQLLAGKTLDALISLKTQGGTLGALSEQEGQMMRSAASKIGAWRKVDQKTGDIYFNTSEASFKKELETLKRLTDKAIANAGGSVITPSGNTVADAYVNKSMQSLQSSQIMTPAQQGGYVDNQK